MLLNRKATRKRVEEVLEKIRYHRQYGVLRWETRVTTPLFKSERGGPTNKVHRPTEEAAVRNAELENELNQLSDSLTKSLYNLSDTEKEIIEKRYLSRNQEFDYIICHSIGMSERTYRRIKTEALFKIALMMRLEIQREEGSHGTD